jgi:hypothetical protein
MAKLLKGIEQSTYSAYTSNTIDEGKIYFVKNTTDGFSDIYIGSKIYARTYSSDTISGNTIVNNINTALDKFVAKSGSTMTGQLQIGVANGTAPISAISSTVCPGINADMVDNQNFSYTTVASPTYLWCTNTNGTSNLVERTGMTVGTANTAITANKTVGTLTVTGAASGTFNGDSNVTITIPSITASNTTGNVITSITASSHTVNGDRANLTVATASTSAGYAKSYAVMLGTTQLGETINIPKDQFLSSVTYDESSKKLIFNVILSGGTIQSTSADLTNLIDVYDGASGIKKTTGTTGSTFTGVVASSGNEYLGVNTNGFYVTGVSTDIATAKSQAISTAASDATTKANNAYNNATAYTTAQTSNYLPLIGGTMTGQLKFNANIGILGNDGNNTYFQDTAYNTFFGSDRAVTYIRSTNTNLFHRKGGVGDAAILDGYNYSNFALPLNGGTMSNTNLVTNLNADLLDGVHNGNITADKINYLVTLEGISNETVGQLKDRLKLALANNYTIHNFNAMIYSVGSSLISNWNNNAFVLTDGAGYTTIKVTNNVGNYAYLEFTSYYDKFHYSTTLTNNVWGELRHYAFTDNIGALSGSNINLGSGYTKSTAITEADLTIISSDTINNAISKLSKTVADNEEVTAGGLNKLNYDLLYTKAVMGQNTNEYSANTTANYINVAIDMNDADIILDTNIKKTNDRIDNNDIKISKITDRLTNIDGGGYYGVEWDTTISSPKGTRIGNMALHKSLPVQNMMKGVLLDDDGNEITLLGETSWLNDTRDGSMGQVMVKIPNYYYKVEEEGNKFRFLMSTAKIEGFNQFFDSSIEYVYCSAYEAGVDRTNNKLVSIVNESTQYRGGYNQSGWDGTYRTLLNRPATAISRASFRNLARNRNTNTKCWNEYHYLMHVMISWLFYVEYATLNSQDNYNSAFDINGYRQGGLGPGISYMPNWNTYNDYNPFIPNGYTDSLGNSTGVINYDCKDTSGGTYWTGPVPRYRGIQNPFGHIWKLCDGIIFHEDGSARTSYVTNKIAFINNTIDSGTYGMEYLGNAYRGDGWVTKMLLGKYGALIPTAIGGNSATYWCDYYYQTLTPGWYVALVGGLSLSGACGGFGCLYAFWSSAATNQGVGSRLCFIAK